MKKLQLFSLASLLMLTLSAQANASVANDTIVGSLEGELNVTQGNLSWGLPLDVPAGVNGIQPDVGIGFQQGKGNGLLGLGFQISGIPAITRCSSTSEYDAINKGVDFNTGDKYCLGGQRLIAINGQYGAHNTEYRTATESFSKIISKGQINNGPKYWEVYAQDGTIYEYGKNANSRLTNHSYSATLHWNITTQKDRFNNKINYYYQTDESSVQRIPSKISWNNHSVHFRYKDRPDVFSAWQYGDQKHLNKRVSQIDIQTNNETSRSYHFNYQSTSQSNFSRLDSIKLCVDNKCTPPTQFTWRQNDHKDGLTSRIESVENVDALEVAGYAHSQIADINQDGFEDICILKQGLQCGLNDGTGKMLPLEHWTDNLNNKHWHHPKYAGSLTLVDLNNDAFPDYCIQDDKGISCGINNNGNGFLQQDRWSSEFTYKTFTQLNDINGDGFTDICLFEDASVSCALNQQGKTFTNSTRLVNGGWPIHYKEEKSEKTIL
jgi:hypothetical protein